MKNSLLVTRPAYDDATSYLYHYAGEVINYAREKDINVLDLERPRLTKKNFTKIVSDKNPYVIFFNAHGDSTCIYGDKIDADEEILIEENVNHDLLNNKVVYARACYAGASLGEACVKIGGCFIGYESPFTFWIDANWSATPLKDETAKLFLEPSNMIVLSLLKGNSVREAVEKSVNLTKKNIMKLMSDQKEPGYMASIMALWSNLEGQVVLGDKDMKME